jgi:hypothetical protein
VYMMKEKSEALRWFKIFKSMVENESDHRMKTLRTEGGGEYCSNEFDSFLRHCGINREKTPPYTPERNGVAERANRTLIEAARSLLHRATLPINFWAEAVETAAYIRNRCPTSALNNLTPFEAWTGSKPSLSHLRVFGCTAFAHIPRAKRTKLDAKAEQHVFVVY